MTDTLKIALYLDDVRTPCDPPPGYVWRIVRNYEEFTEFITELYKEEKRLPDLISFDHDLGEEHMDYHLQNPVGSVIRYEDFSDKTGMHCARWLTDVCERNDISLQNIRLCVHSHNPVGATNIQGWLNNFKRLKYGPETADCFTMKWKHTLNPILHENPPTDNHATAAGEQLYQNKDGPV
jgi:hypothetical protein